MKSKEIASNIYYAGVNDRHKELFENLWPIPQGVSYNSYLIKDSKTALVDTVDVCYSDIFLKKVTALLDGRPLDYLVINHMEPDHSGSVRLLKQLYPDMQIVGNIKTFGMLEGFHGVTDGLIEVKAGSTLPLGNRSLTFYMAPMVHWPEVMFAYDEVDGILFSADAFGTYGTLDGGVLDDEICIDKYWEEMIRYYSNIVGKYGGPVQKAIKSVSNVNIKTICSTHGPVWRKHISEAVSIYDRMSRYEAEEGAVIMYGTMYGNTEQMAEAVAYSLVENGIRNVVMHNLSKSHPSYVLKDVFKYRGLIAGSPTYCNQLFPEVESMLAKIEMRDVKNRIFGYFGSYSWADATIRKFADFAERMRWETAGEPVNQKHGLSTETYEACLALGKAMAAKLKNV